MRGGDGPGQDPRSWAVPPLLLFRCCLGCFPYAVMVSGDGDLGWSCLLIVLRNVVGPCCVPGL